MCTHTARSVVGLLVFAAATLGFWPDQVRAQCQRGPQMRSMGMNQMSGRPPMQNMMMGGMQQQNPTMQSMPQQQNSMLQAFPQQGQFPNGMMFGQQQGQNTTRNTAYSRPRKKRSTNQDNAVVAALAQREPARAPEDPETTAASRLQMARQLAGDAAEAQENGESGRAFRLRARAGARLSEIVEKYPETDTAASARELLEKLESR